MRGQPRIPRCVWVIGILLLAGCSAFFDDQRKTDRSSSIVNYLYPGQANPLPPTSIPVLHLPLRVGIAFVPSSDNARYAGGHGVSEVQKQQLLARVADQFRQREFIQSIELIPTTYLRPGGGFDNLDQVSRLLSVDVVVLVAYDQVQFSSENKLSLAYWTIVGAYFFHGNKNDTQTLMEAAVYDVPSRHLLFRAPGVSETHATSTAIEVSAQLQQASAQGFAVATDDLIKNLQTELERFRERVKSAPETVRIEKRAGYTGGGASEAWFASAVALLALARWIAARRRTA